MNGGGIVFTIVGVWGVLIFAFASRPPEVGLVLHERAAYTDADGAHTVELWRDASSGRMRRLSDGMVDIYVLGSGDVTVIERARGLRTRTLVEPATLGQLVPRGVSTVTDLALEPAAPSALLPPEPASAAGARPWHVD